MIQDTDILLRFGGAEFQRTGALWRRRRLDIAEGEAPTITRADASTCASYHDQDGNLRNAAAGKLRVTWLGGLPYVLIEGGSKNICLQSENFGSATWVKTNATSLSSGAKTLGALSMDLVGDVDNVNQATFSQNVTLASDGTKCVSVYVAKGTIIPSSYCTILLKDSTNGNLNITADITWNGTVPVVNMEVGTFLGMQGPFPGGVYRLFFQGTGYVAAHTNTAFVIPARTPGSDQGNIYVGGYQVEELLFPSSYIKTTTATVTRSVDFLSLPLAAGSEAFAAGLSMYAKCIYPWQSIATQGAFGPSINYGGILVLGDDTLAAQPVLWLLEDDGFQGLRCAAIRADGSQALSQSSLTGAQTLSTVNEVCAQFDQLLTSPRSRLDTGSGFTGYNTGGSATGPLATPILPKGYVGARNGGTIPNFMMVNRLIVARGLFTLADFQALPA